MLSLLDLFCLVTLASLALVSAVPSRSHGVFERDDCVHGPTTRGCWEDDFSISTDFDTRFPHTGNTVSYTLDISNGTCNRGGSGEKVCFFVNGESPGPTIRATWGDILSVTVNNNLQHNATSIHWHGIRQYNTPGEDGVNGVSSCAIAPGDSKTYTFPVTQYGTGWYHSHTSAQYGDGVLGNLVFDGPASANYDIDLGPYMIHEIYQDVTAFQVAAIAQQNLQEGTRSGFPLQSYILINGTGMSPASGRGNYNQVTIVKGKKYRLRLLNAAIDSYIHVSLDQHIMEVIAADFVPIKPFTTEWLLLAVGQRYDIVIDANQSPGNYWFRVVQGGGINAKADGGRAIWTYEGSNSRTPSTSPRREFSEGLEPAMSPYWKQSVPSASFQDSLDTKITNAVVTPDGKSMVVWVLNKPIWIDYAEPTMGYIMDGNASYPETYNVIEAKSGGNWNYWLIWTDPDKVSFDHPIHLHGHDFFVIGQGTGAYDEATAKLNWDTPVRRDTANLPARGWLALAFMSNNPGAWLMHCHIAWHIGQGLGMQYVESPDQIVFPDRTEFAKTCDNYKAYANDKSKNVYLKHDSGL